MRTSLGRAVLSLIILAVVVFASVVLSKGLVESRDGITPHRLTILFTGDILGSIKSCGCHRTGDLGGAPRQAAYMKKIRGSGGDVLLLDVGDAIYDTGRYAEIKAGFFAKAFSYMGYDAIGMGDADIRFMRQSGRSDPYSGSIPVICANVIGASTEKPLADPYIVKKTPSGLRVGVISVLGGDLIDSTKAEVRILPPAEVLRKYIGELREKSDLVVVLSHTGIEKSRELASEVPGADVILSGHSFNIEGKPLERIGGALLMQTGVSGKYVGKLALEIGADRKIVSSTGECVGMSAEFQDDPEIVKLIAQHDKELEDYYASIRAEVTGEPHRPKPFVSAMKCRECHVEEYEVWQKTGHADAFESLKKDQRSADPECQSCHTTGFRSSGGYTSESATPQLKGVQCEACHGPGVTHARKSEGGYGAVSRSICVQCHDVANSPKFSYSRYKPRITHQREEEM